MQFKAWITAYNASTSPTQVCFIQFCLSASFRAIFRISNFALYIRSDDINLPRMKSRAEIILSHLKSLRLEEILGLGFIIVSISSAAYVNLNPLSNQLMDASVIRLNLTRILLTTALTTGIFWLIFTRPNSPRIKVFRDFSPYLIILVIFMNYHDMISLLNPNDIHVSLAAWDASIFGIQPTVWMEQFYQPWLTEWFALAYVNYYVSTLILLILLYRRGQFQAFRSIMLFMMVSYYIGFIGYLLFPASSPYLIISNLYTVDIWKDTSLISKFVQALVSLSPSRVRDAFPSMHNAITLLTMMMAWRYHRTFFWIQLPLAISLVPATVYLRYHWVVDIFAAIPLLLLAFFISPKLENRWQAFKADRRLDLESG